MVVLGLLGVGLFVKEGRVSQNGDGDADGSGLSLTMWLNAPAPGVNGWSGNDLDAPPPYTFVTGYSSTTGLRTGIFLALRFIEFSDAPFLAHTLFDHAFMVPPSTFFLYQKLMYILFRFHNNVQIV